MDSFYVFISLREDCSIQYEKIAQKYVNELKESKLEEHKELINCIEQTLNKLKTYNHSVLTCKQLEQSFSDISNDLNSTILQSIGYSPSSNFIQNEYFKHIQIGDENNHYVKCYSHEFHNVADYKFVLFACADKIKSFEKDINYLFHWCNSNPIFENRVLMIKGLKVASNGTQQYTYRIDN